MCVFDVQSTTVNDHITSLSVVTLASVCSCKECARDGGTYLNDRRCDLQRILAKIYKLKGILSSPTSYFSYPFLGTATRRTILVHTASPVLGAVGNWSPPSPSASSPSFRSRFVLPGLGLQLVRPFCKSFSSAFDVAHHLVVELLKLLSRSPSQAALSPEKLSRLLLLLLEALHFLCTRLPTFQISPQGERPHVHELLALLGIVFACGLDVEVQGFVNQGLRWRIVVELYGTLL